MSAQQYSYEATCQHKKDSFQQRVDELDELHNFLQGNPRESTGMRREWTCRWVMVKMVKTWTWGNMKTSGRLGTAQGGPVFSGVQWQCQLLRPFEHFGQGVFCERLNIAGFQAPVAARDNLSDWLRGRHLLRAAAAECRKILPSMVQDCQIEALKSRQNDPPISLSLNSRIRTLRGSVSECISYLFFFCFCVFWSWKHCFSFWLFVCFSILSFRLFELRFRSMSLCFLSSRFPCRFRSGSRAVRPLDSVANCSPSAPRLWSRISKRGELWNVFKMRCIWILRI